jgi:hypothetical protein
MQAQRSPLSREQSPKRQESKQAVPQLGFMNPQLGFMNKVGIAGNPVFQKDFQSRFKMRRLSKWLVLLIRIGIALILLLSYGLTIYNVFWLRDSNGVAGALAGWMGFFAYIIPPALASGSITTERENQTWNALLLSRLKPSEIVLGKFWAALLPVWGWGLAMLPLGILLTITSIYLEWYHLVLAGLGYLSISAFGTALSLFSSWVCRRRTAMANCVSIVFIALYHVVLGIPALVIAEELRRYSHGHRNDWEDVILMLPWILQPLFTVVLLRLMIKYLHKVGKDVDR